MSNLLLTILELLEESSQNLNSGKTQQYNPANRNPNRNVMRPVQRPPYNLGTGGKPSPNGRPATSGGLNPNGSSSFEGEGQGSFNYLSPEGEGQGSLNYLSPEGEVSFEGSHGRKGSLGSKGNAKSQKNRIITTEPSHQPTLSDTHNLDFSEITESDILRGIVFSEILGKPRSLRRGR
ncbi:hypothetical protein [Acetivibrio mesophilus]|uniref:Uncharacterized protein n=1 Tax=Acetivibrio mesophilus TaxID=2487273 RepID=A0A4Q0I6Z6_9FIRM|nr:hypothetical protein [Acetivibrio mesophilus]RXE59697.1 hypothetical protein EFD62_05105 [Acetivibrio mesophilus]